MGIQNFIDGGFIGKVGDVVGQRWKDKKMVRAYVKGKQPNTPAQINVRDMFRQANQLAQEAMNINGHTGIWDTSKTPEYSQRVGLAFKRLKAGMSPGEALPLYPEGYNPSQPISILNWTYNQSQDIITINTSDFGTVIPATAVLKMYSPLYMSGSTFNELQVNAACSAASIFFSASKNPQALQALQFGLVAIYGTFYDQDGTELTQTTIEKGYAIANKLYYFSETMPVQTINPDTYIRRAITGGQTICRRVLDSSTQPYAAVAMSGSAVLASGGNDLQLFAGASAISGTGNNDISVAVSVQSGSINSYAIKSWYVTNDGDNSYLASADDTGVLTGAIQIALPTYNSGNKAVTAAISGNVAALVQTITATAKTRLLAPTSTIETKQGTAPGSASSISVSGWSANAQAALAAGAAIGLSISMVDQFGSSDTGVTVTYATPAAQNMTVTGFNQSAYVGGAQILISGNNQRVADKATLAVYSPLYMSGNTFTKLTIQAQVQGNALVFAVAQNQQAVNALASGIAAVTASFIDIEGGALSSFTLARGYAVAGVLYDFDYSAAPVSITQKDVFRRAIISGQTICRRSLSSPATGYAAVLGTASLSIKGQASAQTVQIPLDTVGTGGNIDMTVACPVQSGSINSYTSQSWYVKSSGSPQPLGKATTSQSLTATVSISSISYANATNVLTIKFTDNIAALAASGTVTAKTCNAYAATTTEVHSGALNISGNTAVISGWGNTADFYLATLHWVALVANTVDQFGSSDTGITFNMDYWQDNGFKTWDYSINPTAEYFENYWEVDQSAGTVTWICEGPASTKNPYWGYVIAQGTEQPSGESIYIDTEVQNISFPYTYETDLSDPSDEEAETESIEMQIMSKSDANRHPIIYVLARRA